MKINIEEKESNEELEFPCLMEGSYNTIVLFRSLKKGTVIISDEIHYSTGSYHDHWDINKFKKFTGKITLEND